MKFNTISGSQSCEGKFKFMTIDEAKSRICSKRRGIIRPYHCAVCGYWHNGSHENARKKRLARAEKKRKKLNKSVEVDRD